ncbi:hypothetical protein GTP41_20205 [Pseudoduganella sp. DS3]|uniref:Uncharacterized protein n=1 Tax=Pseudoduganella guangdongensis TaxID=2692179 RepID=A0A6N9HMB3_9BURK|nr:hypothetical protein [Pseudoduganella guangdongensis]MYN04417.1 hypothetical protein [Pseudoduganella guangdongensis]
MRDVTPKFRCAVCRRGVLNRAVARCLYCGADLPQEVRLAPELVAQREANLARAEAARARLAQPAPQQAAEGTGIGPLDVIEGIDAAAGLADMIGDGISAIGDLLS